jgi:hypothetical protein
MTLKLMLQYIRSLFGDWLLLARLILIVVLKAFIYTPCSQQRGATAGSPDRKAEAVSLKATDVVTSDWSGGYRV